MTVTQLRNNPPASQPIPPDLIHEVSTYPKWMLSLFPTFSKI